MAYIRADERRPVILAAARRVCERDGPARASMRAVAAEADIAPGAEVINLYGPSETTLTTTWHRAHPPLPSPDTRIPVGTPIRNTRVHVLDDRLRPVGVGLPGRVYVGGAGLTRGYHHNAALTAERFVPDPAGHGERLYDTGDRGRMLPSGMLQYLGRTDHQLKVNGVRIDPAEVEVSLTAHPAVAEAAVTTRPGPAGHQRLVGYLVAAGHRPVPAPQQLRAHLAGRLPGTHIPAGYVWVDRLPKTATGKLDRAALPPLGPETPASAAGVASDAADDQRRAPRTPAEELLTGLLAEILGHEDVAVTDDFFALGGHSLLAARLTARIGEVLGVTVPLRTLFESPTAAGLAAWAEGRSADSVPPLVASPGGAPVLSAAQLRLWSLERRSGRYALYNVPVIRRLRGPLDVVAMQAALTDVVRRHEALRTVFPERAGRGPVPELRPATPVPLPVEELGGADEHALRERLRALTALPFDLAEGPLLRAGLVRLVPDDHILHVTIHHMVADGWSVGVLLHELTTLYGTYTGGPDRALPDLPFQYADFAAWQRSCLDAGVWATDFAYWREQLTGLPPLFALPDDYPGITGPVRPSRGRSTSRLPDALASDVRVLVRRLRATPFMVLFSAFQAALAARFGARELGVAVSVANRDRPGLDRLIGFVANTVVVRGDLPERYGFADLVAAARHRVLEAHAHRDFPVELLLHELEPHRAASHAPLAQALFNMQDFPHAAATASGLTVENTGLNEVWARYPLTLFAHHGADGTVLDLVYDTALFRAEWADGLLAHMAAVLHAATDEPGPPPSGLARGRAGSA